MGFSRQEYQSGLPFLSPGDLPPAQGSNPGLMHCRQVLYSLSHQGRPVQKEGLAKCCNESWAYVNFKKTEKKEGRERGRKGLLFTGTVHYDFHFVILRFHFHSSSSLVIQMLHYPLRDLELPRWVRVRRALFSPLIHSLLSLYSYVNCKTLSDPLSKMNLSSTKEIIVWKNNSARGIKRIPGG